MTGTELTWRRSSQCDTGTCVEVATLCDSGSCVEVATSGGGVAVRDSKHLDGPILRFTNGEWATFVAGIKAGDFRSRS